MNKEKKSIFNPIAKGINPKTVVIAVNTTGRKRAFPPTTIIRSEIPQDGIVTIKVYDILGQEVRTVLNEFKQAEKNLITGKNLMAKSSLDLEEKAKWLVIANLFLSEIENS